MRNTINYSIQPSALQWELRIQLQWDATTDSGSFLQDVPRISK